MRNAHLVLLSAAVTVALTALAGNALNYPFLCAWSSTTVAMKATTAWLLLEHVYAGWLLSSGDRAKHLVYPLLIVSLASLLMVVGVGIEIITKENIGSFDPKASFFPSLMTVAAVTALAAKAITAVWSPRLARAFSWVAAGIGGSALLGYILGIPALYFFIPGVVTAMAIPTAVVFLLLGLIPVRLDYADENNAAILEGAIKVLQDRLARQRQVENYGKQTVA